MQISQHTIDFFYDLRYNNNKAWFHSNKERYNIVKDNIRAFMRELNNRLNEVDVIERYKISRINRDIRFSKDKTIYKDYFWGSFVRFGKARRGGYVVCIDHEDKSFCGGGFYKPNKEDLYRIRKEFEVDQNAIKHIIKSKSFTDIFGNLIGEKLKTAPRGFSKDLPNIDLIRMKQFTVKRTFTNADVVRKDFIDMVFETYKQLRQFFDYMSMVLTTDLNGVSLLKP
ncbi:MAG: DUF2461 domain-containing protein [Saprospiraceae bacterium]|nr:DUF2461 domain-containing protein [Saprospiraceae bacterium]